MKIAPKLIDVYFSCYKNHHLILLNKNAVRNTLRPHPLPVALNIESVILQEALSLLKFHSRDQVLKQHLEIE
jgi:hypothetical protein